jgi:hypothetical protein
VIGLTWVESEGLKEAEGDALDEILPARQKSGHSVQTVAVCEDSGKAYISYWQARELTGASWVVLSRQRNRTGSVVLVET